jgi:hypothetical protein
MRSLSLLVVFVCAPFGGLAALQDDHKRDIAELVRSLEEHSQTPDQLLDPAVSGDARKKSLSYLNDRFYRISFYDKSAVVLDSDRTRASQDTRVHFEDGRTKADLPVTLKFVKHHGKWYFATYEFLGWPATLIVIVVVFAAIGIAYAATVLVLKHRLTRAGKWDLTTFLLAFIPLAWPHLWRESSRSDQAAR